MDTHTGMKLGTQFLTKRCQALDCRVLTDTGYYCQVHARDILGLCVKPSTIKNAGLGLFATRPFAKDERIDEYRGDVVEREVYEDEGRSDYAIDILDAHYVINAIYSTDSFARYSNDARDKSLNNADLRTDEDLVEEARERRINDGEGVDEKDPEGSADQVWLVATRDIKAGQEIFTSYGTAYWENSD